jgi:hypothetical protein
VGLHDILLGLIATTGHKLLHIFTKELNEGAVPYFKGHLCTHLVPYYFRIKTAVLRCQYHKTDGHINKVIILQSILILNGPMSRQLTKRQWKGK